MLQLLWNFSAHVSGGPAMAATGSPDIAALDKAVVAVVNDGVEVVVDLQPADLANVLMLVVQSSVATADVTVKLRDKAGGGGHTTDALPLTQPLLLSGGAIALLPGAPKQAVLKYAAGGAADTATIELVAARKL